MQALCASISKTTCLMTDDEGNEVWERLRAATLKRFWLRVLILVVIVVFELVWFTKRAPIITKQGDGIIFSVGFVVAVVIGLWIYFDSRIFGVPDH
jgi:hypothetical protein